MFTEEQSDETVRHRHRGPRGGCRRAKGRAGGQVSREGGHPTQSARRTAILREREISRRQDAASNGRQGERGVPIFLFSRNGAPAAWKEAVDCLGGSREGRT